MKRLVVQGLKGYLRLGMAMICCLAAAGQWLGAQVPANGSGQPAPAQPAQKQEANPFPEDTSSVPVMPNNTTPAIAEETYSGGASASALPSNESDPVKSPDDPPPTADNGVDERESSSSFSGMDKVLNPPDDEPSGKHRKLAVKEPDHQETSAEDIEVGKYELDRKNWKAALSRFQSALVLAPDEPEVYWGLAESERNLRNFAEARGYYQKVLDYDPDSKHGKEARKMLKAPEIANAKAGVAPGADPAK